MKDCWFWQHDWTKWTPRSSYSLSRVKDNSVVEVGVVFQRECQRCGLPETRKVPNADGAAHPEAAASERTS